MFNIIKFFGEPLKEIKSKTSGKMMFRFDTLGQFITEDEEIIARAKGHFDYLELKAEPVGTKIKKTVVVPVMTITTKDDNPFACKKCDFKTDNKGLLMAHYKTHKEE